MAVMNPWKVRVLCSTRDAVMESSLISKQPLNPRQFEYHPVDPSLLVFGTFSGQVVVWNHSVNRAHFASRAHQLSPTEQVLGLSWLHKREYQDRFVVGSQKGTISLCSMTTPSQQPRQFVPFPHLSSVHVSMDDQQVLVSGNSHSVRIYDMQSGHIVRTFDDIHEKEINLSRFANLSPTLFATCSFDKTVKLWDTRSPTTTPIYTCMSAGENLTICFSPDDQRLLVSAIDDEFNQFSLLNGKLDWGLAPQRHGDKSSYSRSYYTTSGNLILSGSTDHSVVRMYCAHTGRLLHGSIQYSGRKQSALHTLSLRANPHDELKFCALVAYTDVCQINELIENTMVGTGQSSDAEYIHTFSPSWEFRQATTATLLEDKETADVEFSVHSQCVRAHSIVLAARSQRLAALLTSPREGRPCESPVAFDQVTDDGAQLVVCGYRLRVYCSMTSLRAFLVYLYSDNVDMPDYDPSTCQHLVHLALYFDLPHLVSLIEMKCSQNLSIQNVRSVSNFALQNQLHQLLSSCLRYLIMHRGVIGSLQGCYPSIRYLLSEELKGCTYTQGILECYGHLCIVDSLHRLVLIGGICHSTIHPSYISPKHVLVLDMEASLGTKVNTTGDCPSSLVFSAACAIDAVRYIVCGGGHSQQPNDDLLLFDSREFRWSKVDVVSTSSPVLGRVGHSLTRDMSPQGSRLILFGGCNVRTKEYYNDVHCLNITQNNRLDWSCPMVLGTPPLACMAHSATTVYTKNSFDDDCSVMVVFGGAGQGYVLSTLNILHMSETYFRWETPETSGRAPGARYGHSAVWVQPKSTEKVNSILIFGGALSCPCQDLFVVEISIGGQHKPSYATWSLVQTQGVPPSPRYRHSAVLSSCARYMLVCGGIGNDSDKPMSDVVVLDLVSNEWANGIIKTIEPGVDHSIIVQQSKWYTDIVNIVDSPAQSDVVFLFDADTPPLHAHSLFLKRSLHMRRMLQTGMLESVQGTVSLNKSKSTVRALLEFVYTDRLRVLPGDLLELLDLAHSFNMAILSMLLQVVTLDGRLP
ncbi:hypothetical protein, variant 1 [Aphanomyces invadans]|uniref:BTB domain-containing protein n=1 Tax=Aphanomyces invadans TaxID=157072 RepID=A0A024UQK1_9STRA|nr:hypothetical protein, variant 1 [Aphanomyces invadans]ETW08579.1 hypothetical protein, variant 1 [Aphanomyces invadans]|eukprot:XP_008862384.1 hypothetical protein, variant 1 [Aphanomyces invadans]